MYFSGVLTRMHQQPRVRMDTDAHLAVSKVLLRHVYEGRHGGVVLWGAGVIGGVRACYFVVSHNVPRQSVPASI